MGVFPISGLNDKQKEAWKVLFNDYYPALCNYVCNILDNGDNAKDVVQDVFLKLWKSSKRFHSESELTNYLYKACYNTALTFLRNHNLHSSILNRIGAGEQPGDPADELYATTIREELLRELYVHINNLPSEQRKVVLMHIEGYSWDDIARKLNVSINTVMTHRSRAFRSLRLKLQGKSFLLLLL